VKSSKFQTLGIVSAVTLLSTRGFCIPDTAIKQAATGEAVAHPVNSYQYDDTYIRYAENTVKFDFTSQD
jgi:hypothetical protein